MCPIFVGTLDGRGMKRPQVNFFISKGHKISEAIFIGFNYSQQDSKWIQCKNLYQFDFRAEIRTIFYSWAFGRIEAKNNCF